MELIELAIFTGQVVGLFVVVILVAWFIIRRLGK